MREAIRRVRERNNLLSLVAHMVGFLSAMALFHLVMVTLLRVLHGSVVIIWVIYGLINLLILVGCLFIMGMPRVECYVQSVRQFVRVGKFAFVTTLLAPLLLVGIAFALLMGVNKTPKE